MARATGGRGRPPIPMTLASRLSPASASRWSGSIAGACMLIVCAGCGDRLIERDGPAFAFDPDAAWRLRLAFGSGLEGMESVDVRSDGLVTMVRRRRPQWQSASETLGPGVVDDVRDLLIQHRVAGLKRLYDDPDVYDGEQWLLCLEQGAQKRIVYCNNHFPPRLRDFLQRVRALVEPRLTSWTPLEDPRAAEMSLWNLLAEQPVER